ncbi:helix-turn-helix domain-containing protein [Sphaerisporangium sp. TRM90804]|uniref:helix-turn-helix domain-containing protein n=1 Tax=Sphaerisporangium sp. TRM90804 TaxID=3031113 RepID=UPI00244BD1C1|nr:helix-turn-helix domain-containing protein [Sphaerisporangium sp. TRM90804]MDH2428799.1 helix-turn-helix domain-containing protein [Sphaerisporangium sp. TRM90804]
MSAERVAQLLSELKLRSGRTYEALGLRTGMSRSTVHRYCRGAIIPDSYGPLERIAKACGATKDELDELYRRWAAAGGPPASREARSADHAVPSPDPGRGATDSHAMDSPAADRPTPEISAPGSTAHMPDAPDASDTPDAPDLRDVPDTRDPRDAPDVRDVRVLPDTPAVPGVSGTPDAPGGGPRSPSHVAMRLGMALLGAALVIVCLVVLSTSAPPPGGPARQTATQWITGPAWSRVPAPVPRTLFGVTINSATGTMPGFRVGAVRLWDGETRWAQLQPERDEFDWSALDRLVGGAQKAGLPALFVFGGTPPWASPAGPSAPYPDGSRASPPDALADWDTFVRALTERYKGRIEAYELWVLANDRRFYAGSVETLVEMTRRASAIIRAADRAATVVCPGMGQLWTNEGRAVLRRFAELGGYGHCDVAGIKLYQRTASDPPESMLALAATVDRVMHEAGVQPRLWSTGTAYSIPLERPLDEVRARDYAVRFYLTGLYARHFNLERMYFYNWGGTKIPIVLQAEGGAPTRAALAVEQLQRWLAYAESRSCGQGLAIGLPENVWQCELTITEPDRRYTATLRWAVAGTAATTAGPRADAARRLDGTSVPVRPGDTITVGEDPVLIEDRPESP